MILSSTLSPPQLAEMSKPGLLEVIKFIQPAPASLQ